MVKTEPLSANVLEVNSPSSGGSTCKYASAVLPNSVISPVGLVCLKEITRFNKDVGDFFGRAHLMRNIQMGNKDPNLISGFLAGLKKIPGVRVKWNLSSGWLATISWLLLSTKARVDPGRALMVIALVDCGRGSTVCGLVQWG